MCSPGSQIIIVAAPWLFWGALGASSSRLRDAEGLIAGSDSILFGLFLLLSFLALVYSVNQAFGSLAAKLGIIALAIVLILAVTVFHWGGWSFLLIAGGLTALLGLTILRKFRKGELNRP